MDHIDQTDVTGEGLAPYEPIPSFLAGLTQAMHETASRERGRMAAVVAEDARTHVEKARARAVVEAGELRRSAEEEVAAINAWSAAEIGRIRDEAERRTRERRVDLETYLQRHASIIEAEVAGVDAAVADYEATLDAFIDGLLVSNDASEIARRAGILPAVPDLDGVRATARAAAVAGFADADDADEDGPGVAVMGTESTGRPDGLPLAVDPLQAPEEDWVAVTVRSESGARTAGAAKLLRTFSRGR